MFSTSHIFLSCLGLLAGLAAMALTMRADVLVGANGERFVGRIISTNDSAIIFESEPVGRLTVAWTNVMRIQSTPPVAPVAVAPAARPPATNLFGWLPPGVGQGKNDWVQLKSGEWLRGQFKYLQQKKVEFDSDELDQQTFDLKNVWQLYPVAPMWVRFDSRPEPVFGNVVLSNGVVTVDGLEPLSLPREQILGITPSGAKGMRNWSGNLTLGLSLQAGNNSQTTFTTSGELARRTPNTELTLNYLGNQSQANDQETANNQRVNLTYDIRLSRHWFVRPVQLEYYQDSLANLAYQITASTGAGYYIFDQTGLSWYVAAGPGCQYTKFSTVQPGESDTATTPAGLLYSKFKMDLTRRLDLSLAYRGTFTSEEAGRYTHHTQTMLSFEIKRHLNLDVAYVWDYTRSPQPEADGTVPLTSDSYLTVGLGVRF